MAKTGFELSSLVGLITGLSLQTPPGTEKGTIVQEKRDKCIPLWQLQLY